MAKLDHDLQQSLNNLGDIGFEEMYLHLSLYGAAQTFLVDYSCCPIHVSIMALSEEYFLQDRDEIIINLLYKKITK